MQTHRDIRKCRWGRKTQLQRILLSFLTFFFMAVLGITHLREKTIFLHCSIPLQASLPHPNPTRRSTLQKGKRSHTDTIPPSLRQAPDSSCSRRRGETPAEALPAARKASKAPVMVNAPLNTGPTQA